MPIFVRHLMIFLFLPQMVFATEETNRKIVQIIAVSYSERGETQVAEEKLKKHLKEDPADAEAWNLLGELALKTKKPKVAVSYFSRAAKQGAENKKRLYHNNLAEAYVAIGNQELAEKARELAEEFPEAEKEDDELLVTGKKNSASSQLKAEPNVKNAFDLSLGAGFDTNIGSLPDTDTLVTGVAKPESAFALFGIRAERRRFYEEKAWTSSADLQWVAIENQDLKDRGLLSLTLRTETELIKRAKPNYFNEIFFSGTGAFAAQEGMSHRASIAQLGLRWGHATAARDMYLLFRVQGDDFPALKGTIIDPSGGTFESGLGYRTQSGTFNYSLEILAALNNANGEYYRNRRIQVPLLLIHQPSQGFSYGLQALHSRESFEKSSLVEYRNESRLGIFLTYRLGLALVTGLQVEASVVDSNEDYFAYKREAATVYFKYGM